MLALQDIEFGERAAAVMAARFSVPPRQLQAPGLSPRQLDLVLSAALSTPSHGGLRNFRFILIGDKRRDALSEVFEAAKREEDPQADADDIARARDKAYHAPTLILVVARIYADHPDIPAIEQVASAGGALGSLLHAVHAIGLGAMAVSGDKLRTKVFREAFDLADQEHALTFVAIGTPTKSPREKHRPAIAEMVSVW
jgi:nitroreductase